MSFISFGEDKRSCGREDEFDNVFWGRRTEMTGTCDKCHVSLKGEGYWTIDQVLCKGCMDIGEWAKGRSPKELLDLLMTKIQKGPGCYSYAFWIKKLTLYLDERRKENDKSSGVQQS